jgi:hypothetical protein
VREDEPSDGFRLADRVHLALRGGNECAAQHDLEPVGERARISSARLGYTLEELCSRSYAELTHPEDRAHEQALQDASPKERRTPTSS